MTPKVKEIKPMIATQGQLCVALEVVMRKIDEQEALPEDEQNENYFKALNNASEMLTKWAANDVQISSPAPGFWNVPSQRASVTRSYRATSSTCGCDFGQKSRHDTGYVCKHMVIAETLTEVVNGTKSQSDVAVMVCPDCFCARAGTPCMVCGSLAKPILEVGNPWYQIQPDPSDLAALLGRLLELRIAHEKDQMEAARSAGMPPDKLASTDRAGRTAKTQAQGMDLSERRAKDRNERDTVRERHEGEDDELQH